MKLDRRRMELSVRYNSSGNITAGGITINQQDEDTGERLSADLIVTVDQYNAIVAKEIGMEVVAEQRIVELLKIGVEEDDSARFVAMETELQERRDEIIMLSGKVDDVTTSAVQAAEIAASKTAGRSIAALKQAMQKMIAFTELTQEQVSDLLDVFVEWKPDTAYAYPVKVVQNGVLYALIEGKDHTSQIGWEPETEKSLWVKAYPDETEGGTPIIPPCHDVTGGHDVYQPGAMCIELDGKTYRNTLPGTNSYRPSVHPQSWEIVE